MRSVSVVIATYRRPDVLPGCLAALEEQRVPPFEVIVVDQSPDTRTRDLVAARPACSYPLRYVHSDVAGVSLARNIGWRHATGEIVAYTDDDAVPDPGWVEALVRAFDVAPADMVGGRILPLWEGGGRPRWFPASREYLLAIYDPGGPLAPFRNLDLPMTVNAAIKRSKLESLGGFNERIGARPGWPVTGEDSLLGWRVRESGGSIYYQPAALVHHRVPSGRMQRRFYVRRSYLEGVCLVDVEDKRGLLTPERLEELVRSHRAHHRAQVFKALRRMWRLPWNDPKFIGTVGELALSAGILDACRKVQQERGQDGRSGHPAAPMPPAPSTRPAVPAPATHAGRRSELAVAHDGAQQDAYRAALEAALSRAAPPRVAAAPEQSLDAIVTHAEYNERHGVGLLIRTVFGGGDDVVAIRSRTVFGGEERFGRRLIQLSHQGRTRPEVYAATLAALQGIRVRRILCAPYFEDDLRTAIALHDAFDAPLLTWLMDDQNISERNIGDDLMRELLSKSRLRLGISPELEAIYEEKYGVPIWQGPPLVPARLVRTVPEMPSPGALASRQGLLIGNVWAARWFDMLLGTVRESGLRLSWSCPMGVRINGQLLSSRDLARNGLDALGALPEREFVTALRSAPFVVVTSGTLDERDEHPALSRLSLPSRIVFALAVAQPPILVLGHPDTAAARFVARNGIGVVAPYDPAAFREAVERIVQPEAQREMRGRAAAMAGRYSAAGAREWLWDSLERGAPADRRFEDPAPGGEP